MHRKLHLHITQDQTFSTPNRIVQYQDFEGMKRPDMENRCGGKTMLLLLEREDLSSGKFISRQSSVGFSSRIYYRSAEGVPFKWEMRPGKSVCLPEEEIIALPSPSPAMQSLDLPKPSPSLLVENKRRKSIRSKMELLLSWKKIKKIVDRKAKAIQNPGNNKFEAIPCSCSDNKLVRFEFYSSDGESYESSPKSTSSSSSSRFSSVENNVVCGKSLCPSSATARNFLIPYLSCTAPWSMIPAGVSSVHAPRRV